MQYIADKIDSGSEMPSKPTIVPEILQEVHEHTRARTHNGTHKYETARMCLYISYIHTHQ